MTDRLTSAKAAVTSAAVHPLLKNRWSPRGFDSNHRLSDEGATSLLEAARWAPSAHNSQPWRFLLARRDQDAFHELASVLAPGNRNWATNASALLLVATQSIDETGRPRPWAVYDAGQAVAALSIQAEAVGLSVHQMGGFDAGSARRRLDLDDSLTPVVIVAIGRHNPSASLPEPLAAKEHAPRTREPVDALMLPHVTSARSHRAASELG